MDRAFLIPSWQNQAQTQASRGPRYEYRSFRDGPVPLQILGAVVSFETASSASLIAFSLASVLLAKDILKSES
jgi:hypothetical protein